MKKYKNRAKLSFTPCCVLMIAALFFTLCMPSIAYAQKGVPPELASLAGQLYEKSKKSLEDGNASPAHKKALEQTRRLLKKSGVSNWKKSPVKIKGLAQAMAEKLELDLSDKKDKEFVQNYLSQPADKRLELLKKKFTDKDDEDINKLAGDLAKIEQEIVEKIPTRHVIQGDNGESVEIEWKPQTGEVLLRARNDGSNENISEYDVSLVGQADMSVNPETGDTDIALKPDPKPRRVYTKEELNRIRASVLGEWTDEHSGDIYTITATDKDTGIIRPTKEWYNEQIRQTRERLRQTKNAKEFVWEDPKSGEIVRQKRFRRLKEPYVYKGENPLIEDAKERIAELEAKIKELEDERDGKMLPPVEKHDPVNFKTNKKSKGAKLIKVHVHRKDGYNYIYDQASFDGREVAAKRTYKKIEDIQDKLPLIIRKQLIASWSPPGWLGLNATLDPSSGEIQIEGARWSLHVTYSAMFGDYEVSRIHTPYPHPVLLKRITGKYKTAWGAADKLYP